MGPCSHAVALLGESLYEVVQKMTLAPTNGGASGLAVVLDDEQRLVGVLSDGDIRKAISSKFDFNMPIDSLLVKNPITVLATLPPKQALRQIFARMREKQVTIEKVVQINEKGQFVGIINLHELYMQEDITQQRIAVYGLGFVGLTLALTFAENGMFDVVGCDTNAKIIAQLKLGAPHFFEKGLESLLKQILMDQHIDFVDAIEAVKADIHIISVGTPVDNNGQPVMTHLQQAGEQIGKVLKSGDLVVCRSTVPVGTTRGFLVPQLEKFSGLKAGHDFFVAFAPERTVEGNALYELRTLPQIVGGLTPRCCDKALALFREITSTTIKVESLEASEIVKLVNNTFRDVVFSFANEVSYLCDRFNINAFKLIDAANEGYPRNKIAKPSPGVGGVCLAKDPYLYSSGESSVAFAKAQLGKTSRLINERGHEYVLWQMQKFMRVKKMDWSQMQILVVGLAFKGIPETSDTRASVAMDLCSELQQKKAVVYGFDAVLDAKQISQLGLVPFDLAASANEWQKINAVIFMNNHPDNTRFSLFNVLQNLNKPAFIFDGWGMLHATEVESQKNVVYATMGYLST